MSTPQLKRGNQIELRGWDYIEHRHGTSSYCDLKGNVQPAKLRLN